MSNVELEQGTGDKGIAAGELGTLNLIGVPGIHRPREGSRIAEATDFVDDATFLELFQSLLHGSRAASGQSGQFAHRLTDGVVPTAMTQHGKKHTLGARVELGVCNDMVNHGSIALLPHRVFLLSFRLIF